MKLEQILDVIDRATAWAWIRRTHLGDQVRCPICGAIVTGPRALASFSDLKRTYCQAHGSTFYPLSTVPHLRGTEWAPEEYVKLRLLQAAQVQPKVIAFVVGKSPACVKDMIDRCAALEGMLPPGPQSLACSTDRE